MGSSGTLSLGACAKLLGVFLQDLISQLQAETELPSRDAYISSDRN